MTDTIAKTLVAMGEWYSGCQRRSRKDYPKGTISGCLVLLQRLQDDYDLDMDSHLTANGMQVRGASGPAVRRILERFGETRRFTSEGGRTNRGLPRDVESLLQTLAALGLGDLQTATDERSSWPCSGSW